MKAWLFEPHILERQFHFQQSWVQPPRFKHVTAARKMETVKKNGTHEQGAFPMPMPMG